MENIRNSSLDTLWQSLLDLLRHYGLGTAAFGMRFLCWLSAIALRGMNLLIICQQRHDCTWRRNRQFTLSGMLSCTSWGTLSWTPWGTLDSPPPKLSRLDILRAWILNNLLMKRKFSTGELCRSQAKRGATKWDNFTDEGEKLYIYTLPTSQHSAQCVQLVALWGVDSVHDETFLLDNVMLTV